MSRALRVYEKNHLGEKLHVVRVDDTDYPKLSRMHWQIRYTTQGPTIFTYIGNSKDRVILGRYLLGLEVNDPRKVYKVNRNQPFDYRRRNLKIWSSPKKKKQNKLNIGE